jgi:extracellular factor (EF) 3-hydroxypalmitic acid methyl ester biosynthesis protein
MHTSVSQIKREIEAFASYLPQIADQEPAVFEQQLHKKLQHIEAMSLMYPDQRQDLMKFCFDICAEELDVSALFQHSRHKPLGYAGDYLIIDWTYTQKVTSADPGRRWDTFFHRLAVAEALRNRKDFFCDIVAACYAQAQQGLRVLDLASGPCRDLAEALARVGPKAAGSQFHCVDIDERAIAYAKDIVQGHAAHVSFQWEHANVFEIEPTNHYDLLWAAGLFDYLNDRYAVALIKRMWSWAKDGGKIMIGNAHPRNPSRNLMEWCADWRLIHRTQADMLKLCEQADIPHACVAFAQEPLGINIFCIVTRPTSLQPKG